MSEQDTDRASKLEAMDRENAIKSITNRVQFSPVCIDGVLCCIDCEEPIPLKRLDSPVRPARCIDCQTEHEHREATYA